MNLAVNAAAVASAAAPARALAETARAAQGSTCARPFTGIAATAVTESIPTAAPFSTPASFSTTTTVNGRMIEIPVSVDHRARESYARATSLPSAVDPMASRTAASTVAANRARRGKLAAASQWDR